MDVSSVNPEFRQSEITHCDNRACCLHATCVPLKIALRGKALCRQWYFLRWQPSSFLIPSDAIRQLRIWFPPDDYRFCASLGQTGVYEVLVKLDRGVFEGTLSDFCRGFRLEVSLTRPEVWPLACCLDAYRIDVPFWASCMIDRQDGKFVFGDTQLPHLLLGDAKAATEPRHDEA